MGLPDEPDVRELIALARREDLGDGDVTTALMPDGDRPAAFRAIAKECGVFAGREVAPAILAAYDPSIDIEWAPSGRDGCDIDHAPTDLAIVRGPLRSLLCAERVLLNFLQRMCGVATVTRRYVDAIAGTGSAIYDTRKTTPGWRLIDKYAVRCGGGRNHRTGLYDAILVKDNHIDPSDRGRIGAALFEMLSRIDPDGRKPAFVEVEADAIEQVEQLLTVVGVDVILLDNFTIGQLREAVALRESQGMADRVMLEASGGVNLQTVRAIAETGVERISVGAITHSAPASDISLERV